MILDKTVSVKRLTQDSGNANKESYVANAALVGVPIHIQPASPEDTVLAEGVFAQTYRAFTTHSGILNGDHLTDSEGKSYVVKGVENWNFPPLPHFEMTLAETVE